MPTVLFAEVIILCVKVTFFDPRVGGWVRKNLCVNDTGLNPALTPVVLAGFGTGFPYFRDI